MKILLAIFLIFPKLVLGEVIYLTCELFQSDFNIELDIDYEQEVIWQYEKRFEIQEIKGRIITAYAALTNEELKLDKINGNGDVRYLTTGELIYFENCQEIETRF